MRDEKDIPLIRTEKRWNLGVSPSLQNRDAFAWGLKQKENEKKLEIEDLDRYLSIDHNTNEEGGDRG